jgi:queuine tRNA-ribosyltransferase
MGALHRAEAGLAAADPAGTRSLHLVSFERDLDPLALAARHASHFPHLRHPAPHTLLRESVWRRTDERIEWRLLHGDFLDLFEGAPAPDLIFYDPFSSKTDTALWQTDVFARLHRHCRPRPAELYTYAAGTGVRAALLHAGFFVAEGVGTGPKATTTIAYTTLPPARDAARLLGDEWLARWRRSGSKFPAELAPESRAEFERSIEEHPQFARLDGFEAPTG